jgi:hypothetical protein
MAERQLRPTDLDHGGAALPRRLKSEVKRAKPKPGHNALGVVSISERTPKAAPQIGATLG